MRRFLILCLLASCTALDARADYAVLRSGQRLHITGFERMGDNVRLTVVGGYVQVAAVELVAVEPEDVFPATPTLPTLSGPYAAIIHQAAVKHGVDEALIKSVIFAESNFNANAISRRQALGLMQLRAETAARYAVTNVFDPAQNILAGTHYLRDLLDQYHGNLELTLAAYNAGPDRVQQYHGVPPYPETIAYIRRVTRRLAQEKKSPLAAQ